MKVVQGEGEEGIYRYVCMLVEEKDCKGEDLYWCTYTKYCISSKLRCDGDLNCGLHDDTDEAHCESHSVPCPAGMIKLG